MATFSAPRVGYAEAEEVSGLLVVAQCPKPGPLPARVLAGSTSLRRLAAWADLDDPDELYQRATIVNLLPAHPGNRWPLDEARTAALTIALTHDADRVILLGGAVRAAFADWQPSVAGPWFQWRRAAGAWWATSPHPSGLSRTNDLSLREGASTFWRAVLTGPRIEPVPA